MSASEPLWGTPPPRRVDGAYSVYDYSVRGEFNPKDAGSTFAAGVHQMLIFPVAAGLEYYAQRSYTMPVGMAFTSAWLTQLIIALIFKVVANILRSRGESFIRDLGTWLWAQLSNLVYQYLWDKAFGWTRIFRRQRNSPDQPTPTPGPYWPYPPSPAPRRRVLDWVRFWK